MYTFDNPRGTKENIEMARKIEEHLRIPTLPVGIKFYKHGDTIPEGVGIEPDFTGTFCQFVSFSRYERCEIRQTYLIKKEHITCVASKGVLGLEEWKGHMTTGEHYAGVHFETAEAAKISMNGLPKLESNSIQAILVGPLMDMKVKPDVIEFAVHPGMTNKILDGQMWNTGVPKDITYYNMNGICGTGAAQAYLKNDLFLAFPCHGGRRLGLFTDCELVCALNVGFFDEWILGMEKSYVSGHSYPIGYFLRKNPETPPHMKILDWANKKVAPLDKWLEENESK